MGLSYESASSILLCAEDNNSILCFEGDEENEGEEEEEARSWAHGHQRSGLYADFLMGFFPLQSDECLELLVKREVEHMPRDDYAKRLITGGLDISIRRDCIDWMRKVHAYYNFSPLTAYLAVNYLDRFLSAYDLPNGLAWMIQLLAMSCLSLAAKMEETDVPPCLDLQVKVGESKHVFEPRAIQRMELLVLSTLKWRMQAASPFSFIDCFIHKFNNGNPPSISVFSRSAELILQTVKGIDFLVFRPSEIAAAVALSALGETQLCLAVAKTVTCFNNVNKERVVRCYEVIQDVIIMNEHVKNASSSISSVMPQSPNGVLDVTCCLSYMSDGMMTVESHANSPASKRRKISKPSLL